MLEVKVFCPYIILYETTTKKFMYCTVIYIGKLEVTDRPTDNARIRAAITAKMHS